MSEPIVINDAAAFTIAGDTLTITYRGAQIGTVKIIGGDEATATEKAKRFLQFVRERDPAYATPYTNLEYNEHQINRIIADVIPTYNGETTKLLPFLTSYEYRDQVDKELNITGDPVTSSGGGGGGA